MVKVKLSPKMAAIATRHRADTGAADIRGGAAGSDSTLFREYQQAFSTDGKQTRLCLDCSKPVTDCRWGRFDSHHLQDVVSYMLVLCLCECHCSNHPVLCCSNHPVLCCRSLPADSPLDSTHFLFCKPDCEARHCLKASTGAIRRALARIERGVCVTCKLDCRNLVAQMQCIRRGSKDWQAKR